MTVLPSIRQQLLEAAERNAARGAVKPSWWRARWRVPPRLSFVTSRLATAGLVSVTVVVAVGAIVLLGHTRSSSRAPGGAPPATSRQQLLQTLGVLRTAPTAADRAAAACMRRYAHRSGGGARCFRSVPPVVAITVGRYPVHSPPLAGVRDINWDPALIRTVSLGRPGESVTIYAGRWLAGSYKEVPDPRISGSYRIVYASPPSTTWGIVAASRDHGPAGVAAFPTSGATLRAHGFVLMPYARAANTINVAFVVPGGVARIIVGSVSLGGQRWSENATAPVHDNVAAAQLNTPGSDFGGLAPSQIQMTWLDARGQVIRRTTTAIQE